MQPRVTVTLGCEREDVHVAAIRAAHNVHNGPHAAKWLQCNLGTVSPSSTASGGKDIKGGSQHGRCAKCSLLAY